MKKTIRLTESDLHNIVRSALNEVLDDMDDTEKAYWLMRQRQQRPSKSKYYVDYPARFAQKFNQEVYGNGGIFNSGGGYNHDTGYESGRIGVDWDGNFVADHSQTLQVPNDEWQSNKNFRYKQAPGHGQGNTMTSTRRHFSPSQEVGLEDVRANNRYAKQFNRGLDRYNQVQQKYNQQRQSQSKKG